MGRFIYRPGKLYETDESTGEVLRVDRLWADSDSRELYRDAEARLMIFDDYKIPINKTKNLDEYRLEIKEYLEYLFTPQTDKSNEVFHTFGDIREMHDQYNFVEDKVFGRYYYDYDLGKFTTANAIVPIEESLYKIRDGAIFNCSRLDYISSVYNHNLKYYNLINEKSDIYVYNDDYGDWEDYLNNISKTHNTISNTLTKIENLYREIQFITKRKDQYFFNSDFEKSTFKVNRTSKEEYFENYPDSDNLYTNIIAYTSKEDEFYNTVVNVKPGGSVTIKVKDISSNSGKELKASEVKYYLNDPYLGSIKNGVFTANKNVGGIVQVYAQCHKKSNKKSNIVTILIY